MKRLLTCMVARLREPSSYASLAMLAGFAHVNLTPGGLQLATLWGGVLAAILGVVLADMGTRTPLAIAGDAVRALVTAVKALPPSAPSAAIFAGLLLIVSACSPGQTAATFDSTPGRLFCSIQTAGGGAFVASLTATALSAAAPAAGPLIVIATDAGKAAVDSDCAQAARAVPGGVSGVPVSPPITPVNVPQVAIIAPASPVIVAPAKPTS